MNLYGYTAGNPINFVDPSGLSRRLPPCYGPEWYCGLLAALGLTAPVEAPTTTPIRPGDGDWLSPETYPNPFGAPYSPSLPTMTPLKWCGIAGLLLYVSTMCGSTPLGCQSEVQSVPEPLPAPRPDSPPEPVPPPLPRSDNQDTAYRNPAPSEHPRALIEGFFAKNPSASYSPAFHVARGSAYSTQFISLTRSIEVARNWQQPDLPIYIIDLNKVVGTVYDFTVERVLQEWITHPRTQNMARASQEILVEGWIPPQAILGTVP